MRRSDIVLENLKELVVCLLCNSFGDYDTRFVNVIKNIFELVLVAVHGFSLLNEFFVGAKVCQYKDYVSRQTNEVDFKVSEKHFKILVNKITFCINI